MYERRLSSLKRKVAYLIHVIREVERVETINRSCFASRREGRRHSICMSVRIHCVEGNGLIAFVSDDT